MDELKNLQKQNQQVVEHLYAKLSNAQAQFAKAIQILRSSCPYSPLGVNKCMSNVRKLQAMGSYGFINKNLVSEFQIIIPKVKIATNKDVATGSAGEANLLSIARQVSNIYRQASRYN